jgi:quinol monooxygenase YgiN
METITQCHLHVVALQTESVASRFHFDGHFARSSLPDFSMAVVDFVDNRTAHQRHPKIHSTTGDQSMIIATVSYRVAPGKNLEAVEYLQKVAREVKKVAGTDFHLSTQLAGPAGHFLLSAQYESVAKWDEARNKVANDPTFQKLLVESGTQGLFIPGTVETALWQRI